MKSIGVSRSELKADRGGEGDRAEKAQPPVRQAPEDGNAVAVLIAATIVSYIISTVYSRPISEITRGARNISEGDYNVEFKGLSFSEIDTLNETLAYASKELAKTEAQSMKVGFGVNAPDFK